MIELPSWAVPNGVSPSFIDAGETQRSSVSRSGTRFDRPGSHYAAEIRFPPFKADQGRIVLSRLLRATSEGLRIEYPLLGVDQGYPGTPVVQGAGQAGTSLKLRGCTAGYAVREGYWVNVVSGGQTYLYNIAGSAVANAGGAMTVPIWPELRAPPADGDAVELARPFIEGAIEDDRARWEMSLAHHLYLAVSIEELA